MTREDCRFCGAPLQHSFCDLGMSPLSNAFIDGAHLHAPEMFFPLHARVCGECFLVQVPEFESPAKIFSDYAYFSSYSETWLKAAEIFADYAIQRFALNASSKVMEIASNDGYLLQYFKQKEIPVLGIEPAENVARVAQNQGIKTMVRFFGQNTAAELLSANEKADLLIGNNVVAHVPDLNDFVSGMRIVLKAHGVISLEFPHLMRLIEQNQFDTIYHEHFSYFSMLTIEKILARHGLKIFDVQELATHGGSLRVFSCNVDDDKKETPAVDDLRARELKSGLTKIATYLGFADKVKMTKRCLLDFLIKQKGHGKSIAAYGAPAKGNTLLNYCGIGTDFIDYTVDRSPHKQGKFLPGTHIPIYAPEKLGETKPDLVLIMPWNLKEEIIEQTAFIRAWGGRFVVPIPRVEVID
jgi:2-polyprenyl-3-methyl-5-hydroxy-6-metoxy-1,4-benzoquinol methylase